MLPTEFAIRMKEQLGNEYEAFLDTYDKPKYTALRVNPLKISPKLKEEFKRKFESVEWEENGFYYENIKPGSHPYHEAGLYYIQEPSAMMPVTYLTVKPGDVVLDLCAAPGGKTTQIAGYLQGDGLLVSNEIVTKRAKILSENVERMGIGNAVVLNETPNRLSSRFINFFDKILVDAPCSGEGMFKKNDNAISEWSVENVLMCASRQDDILDDAAIMLKPGGRLVYSTCTFSREEDEGSVERFLERHEDFSLVEMKRLYPHKVKGEGHFFAVFTKEGEAPTKQHTLKGKGIDIKSLDNKEVCAKNLGIKLLVEFLNEYIPGWVDKFKGRVIEFGDNLYLVNERCFDLTGLKVERPGLQLGTINRNRFEPAHALALAIKPSEFKNVCNIDMFKQNGGLASETANLYLHGLTFPYDGDKGYYLICVDSYSIGFGKLAGGIMKNHYPKGLRKKQ